MNALEDDRYPSPPSHLVPLENDGDEDLWDRLNADGASNAHHRVFRFLHKRAQRYKRPGIWMRSRSISDDMGMPEATVRTSIRWLAEHGYVERTEEVVDGESRLVIWCLWLMPSGRLDDLVVDFGNGVWSGPRARASKGRRRTCCAEPQGAGFGPDRADGCAHESARQYRKWTSKKNEMQTTDRVRGVVVSSAAPPGEQEKAPPALPLAPELAAAIADNVPDPDEHARFESEAPAWADRFTVAWVVKAIAEAAARRKVKPVHSLADYVRSVLEAWAKAGHPTPRLTRAAARSSDTNAPRPCEQEASKAAARDRESRDAGRLRAWNALADPEREAIEAEVLAENPPPMRMSPERMRGWARPGCLERMDRLAEAARGA
jgi:hypothetical protein